MKVFVDLLINQMSSVNGCSQLVFYPTILGILISIFITFILVSLIGRIFYLEQFNEQLIQEIAEHKKAKETLQQNEQRLRAIFNHSFEFIGLLDLDGRVIEGNQTALDFAGVIREEVIGKMFWETPWWTHSPEYQTQLKVGIKQAAQGDFVRFETNHFNKNKQLINVDFSLKPVRDETDQIIYLIPEGRDITDIKQVQEALKEKQEELQAIFDTFPDLFFRMDSDSTILDYRGQIKSNLSVLPEVFLGKKMLEILPTSIVQQWGQGITEVIASNTLVSLEYSLPMKTGEEYYEARLVPFPNEQVVAIIRNISQYKRAEIDLKRSQNFLQTILDYLPVALFVKDGKPERFGQLLLVNKACEDLFGLFSAEVIGKTGHDLFPAEQAIFYEQKDREAFAKGIPEHIPEEPIDSYNAGRRIVHTIKVPLYDESQQPEYLICITEDITKRKQAELEREASENKLKALLKHSSDIVSIFDEQGRLIYNSPAAQKIHGFSDEEMLGQNTFNFIHPDDQTKVKNIFSQLVKNPRETVTVQYRYQRKGGDYIWMEAVGSNQLDNQNIQGIVANSRDITERKQAEEALRASEEKFRQLAENIREVFWIIDISISDPTYQKSLYVSPAYEEVWGYKLEELYQNPMQWIQAIYPDDQQLINEEYWEKLLQNGFDHEYRIIRPDGTIRWIRDRGFPIINQAGEFRRVTGLAEDITERKEREQEIRRLNEELAQQNHQLEQRVAQRTAELEMLLNTLPDYVFVVERSAMKIAFCNQIFAQGIGFNGRSAVEGKTIFECFPLEQANYFAEQNKQVFNSGETLHTEETISLPDGNHYFDTYKVPLKNAQGEIHALLGTSRDITELVKTQEILRERTNQLEVMNQELDSFCYSVSHDLRAPLRHIHGFVNALKQRLIGGDALQDPKIVHYLEVIENSSQKMGQLIDGLLTLSRVGRRDLVFSSVELNPLVETAINLVALPENKGQKIEFQVENLPVVRGDSALLQQVFVNLLHNAIKFSRGRNPIKIKIGSLADDTIFVSDNGVGFDMQYADQLFGAFQRLHSQKNFEGTGIGLSIVQRIIHRHGGQIWAESTLEQGATFYLKLTMGDILPN